MLKLYLPDLQLYLYPSPGKKSIHVPSLSAKNGSIKGKIAIRQRCLPGKGKIESHPKQKNRI
jgi:hypothetical protein